MSASIQAETPRALILQGGFQGEEASLIELLAEQLKSVGYSVELADPDNLHHPDDSAQSRTDLLVIPNATTIPSVIAPVIEAHAKAGTNIMALATPLWMNPLVKSEGQWISRDLLQRESAGKVPDNVIFDFTKEGIENWERTSNDLENPASYRVVENGPSDNINALHCVLNEFVSWDTLRSPELTDPFPDGHTLTVFAARGGPNTQQLVVEWTEKDGSRWLATVALTSEWRRYVLTPDEFRYWYSVPGRGYHGDSFRPQNAARFTVGLAASHIGHSFSKDQEYWFAMLGTASMSEEYEGLLGGFSLPALDTLSPTYKLFDSTDVASLITRTDQVLVDQTALSLPEIIRSPHPRPMGGGFDKRRNWRWVPLLEARSPEGHWRGNPVTLTINSDEQNRGGLWASFGIDDPGWYQSPAVMKLIGQVAQRMNHGVFIVDGGANFYTYFDDQSMTLGLRIANTSNAHRSGLSARLIVQDFNGKEIFKRDWALTIPAGEEIRVATNWRPRVWPKEGYHVIAELLEGDVVIDMVQHEAHVWRPKQKKEYITVEDGEFRLNGERWRAYGVNYMPSSGLGTEDGHYFENWIGARSYHPEIADRDISHIKAMGMNSVSIFMYHEAARDQNMLDLLRRLEEKGIKANLSLRPGTPMDFPWHLVKDMIQYLRLADNDTVFAYDLAWEPTFGTHEQRQVWDEKWRAWITERYGSIEHAERDWGYRAPRNESGDVINPLPHHVDTHGPWNRMTAAYRRFLDTLLYEKYGEARRLVRSVDPHHHVSFRMSEAANPTYRWEGRIPYDWPYLAAAVDILEPEAYGRIGNWESVKPGWFVREYGRWAGPDLPMIWSEIGVTAWDLSRMKATENKLQFQGDYYNHFYTMLVKSAADGVYCWWYPGGFRYGENSDYGIINPDGTDRPVTKVIRSFADNFLNRPSLKPVDHWFEFDRDKHPDGLAGVYDEVKEEFWQAIDDGKTPGLRTPGTGTTSANCPPLAVGNVPWTGNNPPQYLDAFFNFVEVRGEDRRWRQIKKGDTIPGRMGRTMEVRVSLTNLGEAEWVTDRTQPGWVRLTAAMEGRVIGESVVALKKHQSTDVTIRIRPISVSDGTHRITLGMEAVERTPFGPKFEFYIEE